MIPIYEQIVNQVKQNMEKEVVSFIKRFKNIGFNC